MQIISFFMQTSQTCKSELIMFCAQVVCGDLPCKDLILYVLKKQPANFRRTDRKFNEPTEDFDEPTESRTDRFPKGLRTDRFSKRTNRFSGEPTDTAVRSNRTDQYRNEPTSTAI